MNRLQNLPIKRRITLVIMMTCSVVLLLAFAALASYQLYEFKLSMVRDMTALADVIGKNSRAALAFEDEKAAHETLLALQSEPYVSGAGVYDIRGGRLADYTSRGGLRLPDKPEADGYHFENGHLLLFRPITLNEKRIGTIYLQSNLHGVYSRLRVFGGIALLVLLGSCVTALLISSPLQRPISQPILDLAETAKGIATQKGYAVRAAPQGGSEIGMLTDAFNEMLARVTEREHALHSVNESLRGEIAERKYAEERVQAQLARLELLNQITRAIGERKNLQNIFQVTIRNLEDHLPVTFAAICIYDQIGTLTVASVGKRNAALAATLNMAEDTKIPVGEDGLSRCIRGYLVHEPNTSELQFPFPQFFAQAGLFSLIIAPLLVESKVFGILIASRREANSFSSGECEFVKQLSEHIALAAHQAQLHDALQQAYDDLRQTQQTVMQQERLRALGQMASGIAHDINNAISPVVLYTESLLENEPNLSARSRNYLETIQRSIEDVAATVARMREFYRQREPQLNLTPVHLNRLVQQVVELSRARWNDMPQQRGIMITLATDLAVELPAAMGVESEIREALINLIFNAVDAMPEGGTLTLRTKLADSKPAPGHQAVLQHVQIEVGDSGIGMNEDTRRRCLEPFFTTKGERGTGMGLAMVYGMVRRHRGDIEIESAPGQGTTIRLSFPAVNASASNPGEFRVTPAIPPRARILVVDDDPLLIKSLRDILEIDGHIVETANGGQVGIDAFKAALKRNEPFAVVITDLGMPYVDGRKVASSIKELSPTTPVIMLTGWGQRLVTEGDIPPHTDHVLSKPPKLRELREALAQSLPPATS